LAKITLWWVEQHFSAALRTFLSWPLANEVAD
jgi:hypothetical protein